MIYLDNAATTLHKPQTVIDAVTASLQSLGNAGRGAHGASLHAARMIYDTREKLAALFHAESPSRIAFTCNSTEALNLAIKGCLQPGDHVITTALEHNSVLRPLYEMQERGISLTILPCDGLGRLNYEDFTAAIRPETRAIVCTAGSNLTGNLVALTRVGETAHAHGLLFLVDASQTAGIFPIDVQALHIDILCFTGHKALLGPQGTGGLYVRDGLSLTPLKSGGSGMDSYNRRHPSVMPTALEAGTLNGHGIAGLNAAVSYLLETGLSTVFEQEHRLMQQFYEGIRSLPEIKIYGDFSTPIRCPIVSVNISDYDSSEVSDELLTRFGIATRPGAHCAPLLHKALGTEKQGAVRFSFSHFNTEQEVEAAVRAVRILTEE